MATKKKLRWTTKPPELDAGFLSEQIAIEGTVCGYVDAVEKWFPEYVRNWADNHVDDDGDDIFGDLLQRKVDLQRIVDQALVIPEPHRTVAFKMALQLALMVQTANAPVLEVMWKQAEGAKKGGTTNYDPQNKLSPAVKSKIAQEMKADGYSQKAISERLGVSTRQVRKILNGK